MAARRLTQAYDAALASEGLGVAQFSILGKLARRAAEGPPTVGDLADILSLDRTTLTHNLRPLARDGLVALVPDTADGRARRVVLTGAGRAKHERCLPLWRAAQDRFDTGYGRDASRALRASLLAIARHRNEAAPAAGED